MKISNLLLAAALVTPVVAAAPAFAVPDAVCGNGNGVGNPHCGSGNNGADGLALARLLYKNYVNLILL